MVSVSFDSLYGNSPSRQGAAACSEHVNRSECPWKTGTLSAVEWHMGYIGMQIIMHRHSGEDDTSLVAVLSNYMETGIHINEKAEKARPSVTDCTKVSLPLNEWYRKREAVITKITASGILENMENEFGKARIVKGAYTGPLGSDCPYGTVPPVKAIWLEFSDGIIMDPFRWIMESGNPSVWTGNSDHYDENGARLKKFLTAENGRSEIQPVTP